MSTLKLLTFNVQTGIASNGFWNHVGNSWKHFAPFATRSENSKKVSDSLKEYDLVGLQEVDAGSLRTGQQNQIEFLAEAANFEYWFHQRNRNIGRFAKHSNGLLSRNKPHRLHDYKLPGLIPGRGAIVSEFVFDDIVLAVAIVHLSLGKHSRVQQLNFLENKLRDYSHLIVMGDFNCEANELLTKSALAHLKLKTHLALPTFPSWRPSRCIDQILVSQNIKITSAEVLSVNYSDHLPVAAEISW